MSVFQVERSTRYVLLMYGIPTADLKEDHSISGAALRETYEELGIPSANVEILGMLDRPEYSLGNRTRVWPVVVRVYSSSHGTH